MATESSIEWTEVTWNPLRGCTVYSPGCTHCYAMKQAHRFSGEGKAYHGLTTLSAGGPVWTGRVREVPKMLGEPFRWRKPRTVFVNSMSDLFHKDVAESFIRSVFDVMERTPQHTYQILTKRSGRLAEIAGRLPWPGNVWQGVSVESGRYLGRVDDLRTVPAAVRWLSLEPLLGPLEDLDLRGISWVVVGGESGPGARPMREEWASSIRDQCVEEGVPFFFKQWGAFGQDGQHRHKKANGRKLSGRTWDEYPPAIAVAP